MHEFTVWSVKPPAISCPGNEIIKIGRWRERKSAFPAKVALPLFQAVANKMLHDSCMLSWGCAGGDSKPHGQGVLSSPLCSGTRPPPGKCPSVDPPFSPTHLTVPAPILLMCSGAFWYSLPSPNSVWYEGCCRPARLQLALYCCPIAWHGLSAGRGQYIDCHHSSAALMWSGAWLTGLGIDW